MKKEHMYARSFSNLLHDGTNRKVNEDTEAWFRRGAKLACPVCLSEVIVSCKVNGWACREHAVKDETNRDY